MSLLHRSFSNALWPDRLTTQLDNNPSVPCPSSTTSATVQTFCWLIFFGPRTKQGAQCGLSPMTNSGSFFTLENTDVLFRFVLCASFKRPSWGRSASFFDMTSFACSHTQISPLGISSLSNVDRCWIIVAFVF